MDTMQSFRGVIMPICTLSMLRMELHNVMEHGLKKHKNDWYHEWARTSRGTLSFVWHY